MLAPLLVAIHAGELLLLGGLVRALHGQAGWPWLAAILVAVGVAWSWRGSIVLTSMLLSGVRPLRARLWLAETRAFTLDYVAMTFEPLRALAAARRRRAPAMGGSPATPQLVLIHGWCCNGGVWATLRHQLHARCGGAEPVVVSLQPVLGDMDRMVGSLQRQLVRAGVPRDAPLLFVAHSMGGLVARRWLQLHGGERPVVGLCTAGSPHHGSSMARWGLGRAAAQMRPGNAWLAALPMPSQAHAAGRDAAGRAPATLSIWSDVDNLVVPAASSRLPAGRNLELEGLGHFELLRSPAVRRAIGDFVATIADARHAPDVAASSPAPVS
jgi:pimeloyl-ACP methyl ester carboxylesterase